MKRSTITQTFAIAAVAALVLGTAPAAKADNKGCSNATLKGTFAFKGVGFVTAPPALAGPLAHLGTLTFDGKGALAGTGLENLNGNFQAGTETGTYTVNPDCTGTFTYLESPAGITAHGYFVIEPGFNELQIMETDPGTVVTGIARRQFSMGDWRE